MKSSLLFLIPLLLLLFSPNPTTSLPLSTSSRWIVDKSGRRVKLSCVNWPSHVDAMVAEGLSKQPLDFITKKIGSMGFNCVRFTWALFMVTDDTLGLMTVQQSFEKLGLSETVAGIQANNPAILNLTILETFKTVVSKLGDNNIMVIIDNHISTPGWCCSNTDGNGFFGDEYFDPDLWVEGLTRMATMMRGIPNVIGMSLRNELRGSRQNVPDWYRYMQRGAAAVHSANPDLLVILSGLHFANDLNFLSDKQVHLNFPNKLVFEVHWYAFFDNNAWVDGNPNQVCGRVVEDMKRKTGFLLDQGHPLFLSEFGLDLRGRNVGDNRYIGCLLGFAAELDLDWALWGLQGSYYIREGVANAEEVYGVLTHDWSSERNISFLNRISTLRYPFQGPGLTSIPQYTIIFHPFTGLCITKPTSAKPLQLGPCNQPLAWTYNDQTLALKEDATMCLRAEGAGLNAELSKSCSGSASKWQVISESGMHVATHGDTLCLDVGKDGRTIVTGLCECINNDRNCDPEIQWFKMVASTRESLCRRKINGESV